MCAQRWPKTPFIQFRITRRKCPKHNRQCVKMRPPPSHCMAEDVVSVQWNWNESGFRPPLCTYRLNWARRTSWGWWDDWDDTVLQTQDSKFEPWRSEAVHATSRSRRLPTILTFTRGWGRNIFVSFKPPRPGTEPRTLAWKAAVLTTTLGPPPSVQWVGVCRRLVSIRRLVGYMVLEKTNANFISWGSTLACRACGLYRHLIASRLRVDRSSILSWRYRNNMNTSERLWPSSAIAFHSWGEWMNGCMDKWMNEWILSFKSLTMTTTRYDGDMNQVTLPSEYESWRPSTSIWNFTKIYHETWWWVPEQKVDYFYFSFPKIECRTRYTIYIKAKCLLRIKHRLKYRYLVKGPITCTTLEP